MLSNKVVVNELNDLTWSVSDEDMHGLIEWLNKHGEKVQDMPNVISNSSMKIITDSGIIVTDRNLVVKGTIYCNTIRSLKDWCCKEDEKGEDGIDLPTGVDDLSNDSLGNLYPGGQ